MEANWHSLESEWDRLEELARDRNEQKEGFASSKYAHGNSHFIGLLGEEIIHLEGGPEPDYTLRINGDDGTDFDGVDVKASTFIADPHLKHPFDSDRWADFFVLVAIDVEKRQGAVVGWATKEELQEGPVGVYNFTMGLQRYLPPSRLHSGLPTILRKGIDGTTS